ncbi:MAG: hypothetical protein VW454_03835 [Pelagibacteraceae bacterium]
MSAVNDVAKLYKTISEEVTPSEKKVMKPDHRNPKGKAEKPRGGDPRPKEGIEEGSMPMVKAPKKAVAMPTAKPPAKAVPMPKYKIKEASFEIGPGHKGAMRGKKIYDKGKGTSNPHERDTFLKRTGPQLPLAKKKSKVQTAGFEPEGSNIQEKEEAKIGGGNLKKLSVKASKRIDTNVSGFVDKKDKSMGDYGEFVPTPDGRKVTKIGEEAEEQKFCPFCNKMETKSECSYGPEVWEKSGVPMFAAKVMEAKERGMSHDDTYGMLSNHQYTKKQLWDMQKKATERGDHGVASGIYARWKEMKKEEYVSERSLTSSESEEKERIVKGLKKRASDFKERYGDDYKSVMYATATKMAKEDVEYIEEKARGSKKKSTVHAYDVDETLFGHGKKGKPNVKVHVKNEKGERVKSLSNQEFNTHKLDKCHKYDFGEFQSAKKFKETSSPNKKVVKDIKRKIARGKNVHLVTARSKFDKPDEFHGHLKKHGINVDKKNIHYTGGMSKGKNKDLDVGKKKVKVVDAIAKKAKAKKAHMYDDAAKVHKGFEGAKKDKPTSMKYKTHMVAPDKKTGESKVRSYQATKKEETAYDYWKQFIS